MGTEPVTLILVAGMSGSGKSALAAALQQRLAAAAILPLDNYYLPLTHLPLAKRAQTNFDHPDSLDWPLMRAHVAALKAGEAVQAPVYNFAAHDRELYTRTVGPAAFVIAEGLLALTDEQLRSLADLTVFVDTPSSVCLERRTARDVAERGRTRACVAEQWERTVMPMACEFILPSRQWAQVTVSGDQPLQESSDMVIRELEMVKS